MAIKEELRSRQFWQGILAETLGSLVFVSAVLGSLVPGPDGASPGPIYPALAAGMATVVLGYCFGEISGAQVNPAVTVALLATRKVDVLRAVVYLIAQCLGGILAAGFMYLSLPLKSVAQNYINKVPVDMNAGQALGMEILATFLLGFTVFSVEDQRRREINEPGNLAIGFAVTTAIFIAGRFSGASLNPARSLGPAIILGYWEHHWVYWIGPILGALLAGVSHEFIFAPSASRQKLVACLTCKDIEIVETASVSRSSLSTVTQSAMRNKQNNKLEHS
ncbi:aquaporin-4 [Onychostoma macrolepis]|uniref:aquaporin-4 n=1 Tax=Onychostoma macrolepis TaxID=369639 RepID=UPI00272B21FB|nr:aquaporin-4 [Onychostoma macrolepis]